MNQRRHRSDDVLFISALVALLLGVAFLLYTTGVFVGLPHLWPVVVIAAGGILLYFALAREAGFSILFVGVLFVLEGACFLTAIIMGWKLAKAWPLGMMIAGVSGFVSGLLSKKKLRPLFAVPSIGFAILGLLFSAFSFGLTGVNFKMFVEIWWPTLLIAGGISLFVAYGITRKTSTAPDRADGGKARTRKRAGVKRAESPDNERGSSPGP